MADTSYAQRLADALGVPVTKASWSHEHKLRAKALAKHLDVSTQVAPQPGAQPAASGRLFRLCPPGIQGKRGKFVTATEL